MVSSMSGGRETGDERGGSDAPTHGRVEAERASVRRSLPKQ